MTNNDGRDSRGRFAKGNPGGPGRPKRMTEAEYLEALTETVPLDAWRQIVWRAVADAKDGDAKARDWLAKYLVGNPETRLDVAMDSAAPAVVLYLPDNGRDDPTGDENAME